jgi:hypothetical protein
MVPKKTSAPLWHMLQISDVQDMEMTKALADFVPIIAWKPDRGLKTLYLRPGSESESLVDGSGVRQRTLPVLPGRSRFPISLVDSIVPSIVDRLLRQTPDPARSPLICTVPYFAQVAERWPGPVIYWLTDLIAAYNSANRKQVLSLDRRMSAAATLVCPNSIRLAEYLMDSAACDPKKILVLPNATRKANLLPCAPTSRALKHAELKHIARPIVGVIGNLSVNMDWLLIQDMIARAPEFSWVFIGPTKMPIVDRQQREARTAVMQNPIAHFLGRKPYGELAGFARAFDVAMLPYLRCEPTYSGSSTRFYEHLAACRPMLATGGVEELHRKPPLLRLIVTPADGVAGLRALAKQNFDDGYTEMRWCRSLENTWTTRALSMQAALKALSSAVPLVGFF